MGQYFIGEYPKKSGVRTNLEETNQTVLRHTLPAILQERGYQTIFATDEVRFSNMISGLDSIKL